MLRLWRKRVRDWWVERFNRRHHEQGTLAVQNPALDHVGETSQRETPPQAVKNPASNVVGQVSNVALPKEMSNNAANVRESSGNSEAAKHELDAGFQVGYHSSTGPALTFQYLEITPRVSKNHPPQYGQPGEHSPDRDWRLVLRKKSSNKREPQCTVVHYKHRIFISLNPGKGWSADKFWRASLLSRDSIKTFLLVMQRLTKLDKHLITNKIIPFLEDYEEIPNFGQLLLRVVPTEPYPHMSLNLSVRQCLTKSTTGEGWNDASGDSEVRQQEGHLPNTSSLTRMFVKVLMLDGHAFTVDCSFATKPSSAHYVTLLRQELVWDM